LLEARRVIIAIEKFAQPSNIDSTIYEFYEKTKVLFIDSLFKHAQVLEDSQKLADAYYYYKRIVDVDSSQTTAIEKLKEVDLKLSGKQKPVVKEVKTVEKTAEEIEKIYKDGVAKFFAEDYESAIKLFKLVLKYKPGHDGAQKYLSRAEVRLKALQK
jgi:tetratricopeptide (TPR) repeat protein